MDTLAKLHVQIDLLQAVKTVPPVKKRLFLAEKRRKRRLGDQAACTNMEGRNQDASIESRMEGGEILKQYYQDHFQALIEEKPPILVKKRGGVTDDDKDEK